MKNKVLSIIVALAVLLSLFCGLGVLGYAEDNGGAAGKTNPVSDAEFTLYNPDTDAAKFTVALDDIYGSVGDTVEFSSYIKNNTGLYTAALYLKYDTDVLSPVLVSAGSDTVVNTTVGTVLTSGTAGVEKEVVDEKGNKLGYNIIPFVLENSGMKDSTKNGVLFTIKFKIIATPEYGDTTSIVFANYSETMFTSLEGVAEPVFDEGSVTIGKEAPTTENITSEQTTASINDTTAAKTTNSSEYVHAKENPVSDAEFPLYNAATDADKFTLALDDVKGAIGETVSFSAVIKNNPGIFCATIALKYDSGVLRPIVKTSGDEVVADAAAGTVLASVTTGPINDVVDKDGNPVGYQIMPFYLENSTMENSNGNGVLVTVKFEIISKPTYGDSTSVVFANYDDTMFTSLEDVLEPVFDEGSVTVTDKPLTTASPATTVSPATTASPATTVAPTNAPTATAATPATTDSPKPIGTDKTEPINTPTTTKTPNSTESVHTKTNPVSDAEFPLYNAVSDGGKLTVALDDVTGAIGETVSFSAVIKNNSGLFCATMALKYDSDVLRPIVKTSGDEIITDATAGTVLTNVTSSPINDVVDKDGNKLGYQIMSFILENNSMADTTNNGILVTVKFEIISKPVYGDSTNVVFANYDDTMFTSLENDLEPVFDEGSVTVTDKPLTTTLPATTVAPTKAPTNAPTTTTAVPTTTDSPKPIGTNTTAKVSVSVDVMQPEEEYGSIGKKENNDGTVTLTANLSESVIFCNWVIEGDYEITSGSLNSLVITIMPKSDVVTVNASFVEAESNVIYGDANEDSKINMLDVLLIRKYIAKQPVSPNLTASDVTCDSKINMLDVLLIRKYIAKQPVILGPKG